MEQPTLFERLGERDGIAAVVRLAVDNHFANPIVKTRYEHATQTTDVLIEHAVEFFCTGLSGVPTYEGRPLEVAHAGMNVSEQEFMSVIDDIVRAMTDLGIGEQERIEVTGILYGMREGVVRL